MAEIVRIKIFLHREFGEYFDEKLPFAAFGEDCEKTLEYIKEGKTIPVFSVPEPAAQDEKKGALFIDGKLYKVGTPKEIYHLYSKFLNLESERRDILKINKSLVQSLKNSELPFKIKNVVVVDEKGKENYLFTEGIINIQMELEGWENNPLGLSIWRKETIFESSFKLLEMAGKVKNGKVNFVIDSQSLPEGDWMARFSFKQDNQIREIPNGIEIKKRKL